MKSREYLFELDFLKGISITAVIFIHVSAFALNTTITGINFFGLFAILFNQLSRFCVPIFLMVSAILIFRRYEPQSFKYRHYIGKRAKDLLIPYLLWTLLSLYFLPKAPWLSKVGVLNVIETIFLGIGYFFQLYYISVFFQLLMILLPIMLALYRKPRIFNVVAGSIIAINIVLLGIYEYLFLSEVSLSSTLSYIITTYTQPTLFIWAGYFTIGCLIGRHFQRFKKRIVGMNFSHITIFFILATGYLLLDYSLSLKVYDHLQNPAENFFRISVFLYSFASFLFFFKLAQNKKGIKIFSFLGKHTLGLYIIHLPLLWVLVPFKKPVLVNNWVVMTFTFFLITGLSVLIVLVLKKIPFGKIIIGPGRNPK